MVTVREALEALTTQNLIDEANEPSHGRDTSIYNRSDVESAYHRGYEDALNDLADLLHID